LELVPPASLPCSHLPACSVRMQAVPDSSVHELLGPVAVGAAVCLLGIGLLTTLLLSKVNAGSFKSKLGPLLWSARPSDSVDLEAGDCVPLDHAADERQQRRTTRFFIAGPESDVEEAAGSPFGLDDRSWRVPLEVAAPAEQAVHSPEEHFIGDALLEDGVGQRASGYASEQAELTAVPAVDAFALEDSVWCAPAIVA